MRIFFAVDVHGATTVWRKWITAVSMYEAQALILAGDLTGKALVPIIRQKDGTYKTAYFGQTWLLKSEEEIQDIERKLANGGVYSVRCDPDFVEELKKDSSKVEELMKQKMVERMREWLKLLVEKIDTRKIITVVMPGNDDELVIDGVIKEFEGAGIIYPLDRIFELEGHEVLSFEYVNPTPWNTPREDDERGIRRRLEEKISQLKNVKNSIWNVHCPPSNTNLDLAPKLDKSLKLVAGLDGVKFVHVGSTSVRQAIERYQPLLCLHGHIHESSGFDMIGKTLCLNPGSEYGEGLLRGFIINITPAGVENYWKIQG
ncbi:MAG: phosphoesterase [Caldiserica bacterium]|jgi:Icc-related predicted phosphoesterase|nr:phosphoesterase [Caldisericota bacterium]